MQELFPPKKQCDNSLNKYGYVIDKKYRQDFARHLDESGQFGQVRFLV